MLLNLFNYLFEIFISPFSEFTFMRRSLVAILSLALSSAPIGVLLTLRRMSLVGDAMAHALLPGAAIGFIFAGFYLPAISLGSFIAALVVALVAGLVSRLTKQLEDATFTAFYLNALALGVLLISTYGTNVDLMHLLFGSILAIDELSLILMFCVTTFSLIILAIIYRPLILECLDPNFLRDLKGPSRLVHNLFLVLVVANLVAGLQSLGSLMAVGLMMLPATCSRFWAKQVWSQMLCAFILAFASGFIGLILSYHQELPSSPTIILAAGFFYFSSVIFGSYHSLRCKFFH